MNKLLHERLREQATDGYKEYTGDDLLALADEIERYYIPRPRFEDGEPCNVGDEVEFPQPTGKQKILSFIAGEDGIELANVGLHSGPVMIYANRVKRPSPKALDADGVQIKVGDTVYKLGDPTPHVVEIAGSAYVRTTDGCQFPHPKDHLTHKEPDSLKKLRDDMKQVTLQKDVNYGDMEAWICRLSALIEREEA